MADTTHTIGSNGIVKKLVDLGDGTYADATVDYGNGGIADSTVVLAAPTGSTGGLGKLAATLANTQVIYVRFDASARPYTYVDWVVSHAQQADLVFYKAQSIVDNVTLTLLNFTDTNTIVLNGLTLTGEATAADAAFASRKFYTGGGTDTLDAVELAKLINADYSVVTAGTSVAGTDKLLITTDEGLHTLTARAAADLTLGEYTLSGTQATELANIILAINHKDNVVCASVAAADTVTVGGIVYTAKAGAEDTATHMFSKDTSNDATGTSLAACVNADTATHGISAVNASGTVTFTRASAAATVGLASSNGTRLAVATAGGVPGVVAVATGATGELSITPTWTQTLTVTEAGARLTVTDIDVPGLYATSADAIVTIVPGTPASRTTGELATVISATAAANCTVSQTATLAGLMIDSATAAVANEAATTGTAGTIHTQAVGGYPYCYLGFTADNATPQAVSISAVPRV